MKVLIVGGVAGGASTATRLRRLDDAAEIVILEKGAYVSYANCALPYYIGGKITDKEKLSVLTPERMSHRFAIDVRTEHEAVAVDPAKKLVRVRRLADGSTYEESYDKLVLSPGASPLRPPIPGIEDERIFTLRTIPDTFRIRAFVDTRKPKCAVVVGGGFIGLEMAENLHAAGLSVTVVEMLPQLLSILDIEIAEVLHSHLRSQGVELLLSTQVTGFTQEAEGLTIHLSDTARPCDMVIMAVGVRPDTAFLKDSGLTMTPKGLLITNAHMQTNDPDVYALGDAVQVSHYVSGLPSHIPLAGPANRQARVVADQITGIPSTYNGTQGSSVVQVMGLTVASTGLSEMALRTAEIPYDKVYTTAPSHATYYPGAEHMTIKVLFHKESGIILGGQIIGGEGGVDKRIDVLATAIHARQDAAFLGDLELAYAPPYNSARDPVNMIGYIIDDLLAGRVRQFHWHDVPQLLQRQDITWLDVRPAGDWAKSHIPGAISIPMDELRARMGELDKAQPVYVYCQVGQTSYNAYRLLTQHGFDCRHLAGGYELYQHIL